MGTIRRGWRGSGGAFGGYVVVTGGGEEKGGMDDERLNSGAVEKCFSGWARGGWRAVVRGGAMGRGSAGGYVVATAGEEEKGGMEDERLGRGEGRVVGGQCGGKGKWLGCWRVLWDGWARGRRVSGEACCRDGGGGERGVGRRLTLIRMRVGNG